MAKLGKKSGGKKDTSAGSGHKAGHEGEKERQASLQQKKGTKKSKAGGPNTGPIYYLSNKTVAKACKDETNRVKKACDDDKANSQQQAKNSKAENGKLGKATGRVKAGLAAVEGEVKTIYGYTRHDNNAWIEDHCTGLWLKPMAKADGFDKFMGTLDNAKKGIEKEINDGLMSAGQQIVEMAKNKAVNYAEKAAAREGAALASLVVPGVGEIVTLGTTIWNVVGGVWTAGSVAVHAIGVGKAAIEKYVELKPQLTALKGLLGKKPTPSTVLADMMTAAAVTNPCIQARRCILVPYEETETISDVSSGAVQARSGKGCCPGQTGHHVLPGAMFSDKNASACSKNYDHSKGLVICTEGTGNRVGSHGAAHLALDKSIKRYQMQTGAKTIPYEEACARGIGAARSLNPGCSNKCMKAQLDAHYKEKLGCGNAELVAHSGMGGAKPELSDKEVKKR